MSDAAPPQGEQPSVILRYVTHSRVAAFERAGWTSLGPSPGHHGNYSHIMEWRGDGEPIDPER
jgi:hypothetical protein